MDANHNYSVITIEECIFTHDAVVDDYCYVYRLSAGLLRQATYSTTRLGVYQSLFDMFTG